MKALSHAEDLDEGVDGALTTAAGITSLASDGGRALAPFIKGADKIRGVDTAKGVVEGAQTVNDIYHAVSDTSPMKGGEYRRDGADAALDAVDHGLHAFSDLGGKAGPWGAAAAKALGAGLEVGEALGPLVFGEKESRGAQQVEIKYRADGTEEWNPSTGNDVIDWIAGVGKYTDGRF
jgi:hypothetical protein